MAFSSQLSREEVARYSRQLILPEWGARGQAALKSSSVLVVGVGGLGCPCALYLAAAGIGRLGLLDYDKVELSNLHRQVLHSEKKVGVAKADSGRDAVKCLNSAVEVTTHCVLLASSNALDILAPYDIIVDATDNVATRYLLNDASVLLHKPLVSGSALRFEGQLTVYGFRGGPCYRCLFPSPPPPHTVTNCSEGGVLGVVPGIIGSLQALEVLKIATGMEPSYSQKLLLFDGLNGGFRTISLRPSQPQCAICGENPTITKLIDYELFCGSRPDDKEKALELLPPEDRVSCKVLEYQSLVAGGRPHLLLDVREEVEFDLCHLQGSRNTPLRQLQSGSLEETWQWIKASMESREEKIPVYVVCHRGNDSQLAVKLLREYGGTRAGRREGEDGGGEGSEGVKGEREMVVIRDITGGLSEWADTVDPQFPKY